MMSRRFILRKRFFAVAVIFLFLGCQNALEKAVRNSGYSAYEMIGVEKRDLLKKRVTNARDEQKDASKSFKTALERLQDLYGHEGGNFERQYSKLNSSYEKAADQAEDVRLSIKKVETVAQDLFEEWEHEIEGLQTASLKSRSRQTLADTRAKYAVLHDSLKNSEQKMEPVLAQLKDQTIFLKHNLNAKAIGSLKKEEHRINQQVTSLIAEMNKSIEAAGKLIDTIE